MNCRWPSCNCGSSIQSGSPYCPHYGVIVGKKQEAKMTQDDMSKLFNDTTQELCNNPNMPQEMRLGEKETKMTRQEAIEKVDEMHRKNAPNWSARTVDALEALGLLKFEEERHFTIGAVDGRNYVFTLSMIEEALKAGGYKIVRKD